MFHRRVAKQQAAASRNSRAGACEFPEANVTAHTAEASWFSAFGLKWPT
jgi:hypothetical protein